MNNFKQLGLSQPIIDVLDQLGFENPTPVQEQAIPLLLGNDPTDFIGIAQTGTGKTAAFGLPLIELIDTGNKSTQALIMAPTRELGQQIAQMLKDFSKNNRYLNIEVVYGGAAISNQIRALKRPTQIVVATPGRLLDLIRRKAVKLDNVKYVVLDEADEMLNMGFKEDIDKILSHTLKDRVTWLFSATMPPEIRRIVNKYMDAPLEVSINTEEKINKDISHKYVVTKAANKLPALRRFLDKQPDMRGIMFCRTRRETKKISEELAGLGYSVEAIHGDLSQGQRDSVMRRFKNRSMQLLIATDVAARGIDVSDLTHVLHHTLPDHLDYYTHRSGRTARVGKKGISIVFINTREGRRIAELERKVNIKFECIEVPSVQELTSSRLDNWVQQILNTKVDDRAEKILNDFHDKFAHLSKEDLLKRLISNQLGQLMSHSDGYRNGEAANLNETHNESPNRRDNKRGSRRDDRRSDNKNEDKRAKSGFNRYFINMGAVDGVSKSDLINFLSDTSGIERKFFGQLSLQKNCTYFDVDNEKDQGLSDRFKGLEIEGRSIRVNRDDAGRTRTESSSKKRFKGSGKKSRKKRHQPRKGRR